MSESETVDIDCPECGKTQRVKSEWIGRKGRCGSCGHEFVITQQPPRGQGTLIPTAISPKSFGDDDWLDDDGISIEDAFREAVRKALADGVVTPQDRESLLALRREYGLSPEAAKQIFDEVKATVIGFQPDSISAVDTMKVGKLLQLAEKASETGNHEEAFSFCNKALEEDPQNYHAWFGKAKSAGWLSTVANFRLPEMLTGFAHAVDFAPESKKPDVSAAGARIVGEVTSVWFDCAYSHVLEFAGVDGEWGEFVMRSAMARDGLRNALEILDDPEIAQKAIEICVINVRGVQYSSGNGGTGTHFVPAELEAVLRLEMEEFAEIVRRHEPQYRLPHVEPLRSQCFVVTAVSGDTLHPNVLLMRRFRDEWLAQRKWGLLAIDLYWQIGPVAAYLIRRSRLLKSLANTFIVRPAVVIARTILE